MIEKKMMAMVSQGVWVDEKAGKEKRAGERTLEGIGEVRIADFTVMSEAITPRTNALQCWLLSIEKFPIDKDHPLSGVGYCVP